MRVLVLLTTLIFSLGAWGVTYRTQIHSIDYGKGTEPHLILLTDGHVAFLPKDQKDVAEILNEIEESRREGNLVVVELDKDLNLRSFTAYPRKTEVKGPRTFEPWRTYEPSVITSRSAWKVFRKMRRNHQRDSQCYNRAHVWSFEEHQRSSLNSMKLFLFFTSKYIRTYRYYWWFHVAPMVLVGGHTQSNWRILDRTFTRSPLRTKSWTNIFMRNNAACKIVPKYSDYREHQQDQWCYLIPVSMYFWQPRDIERRDRTGFEKTSFLEWEVDYAYWEAF